MLEPLELLMLGAARRDGYLIGFSAVLRFSSFGNESI